MSDAVEAPATANDTAVSAAVPTRTRKLPLRTRWTLAMVAVGAIPLALLGVATVGIQRDGLEHSEQLHEFAVIDHAGDTITQQLREASDAAHRAGMILTDARIADEDAKIQLAQETMANASNLTRLAIYLPSRALVDTIVRRRDVASPAAPEQLPDVTVPDGQDGVWLPVEDTPQGPSLRYVEPIRRDGSTRAYVMAFVRPEALSELVREISRDRFENRPDGVIVLDERGHVLASGATSGSLAVGHSLLGHDILSTVHIAPADFARDVAFSAQYRAGDEAMVGTIRTLPIRHWAVIARRPAASVFASVARVQRSLAIALAAFLVLAILLSTVLVARTVKPVQALMRLAGAYGQSRFKARSEVRSGDEIELLGTQMETMADAIESSEAEVARRAKVEANLSRFVPSQLAKSIAAGQKSLALGGERRRITVLFADVASFTPFAEGTQPERVVGFLNELFGVLTEVVFRYDGAVDKFIGDCVMAVFGAHGDNDDHVSRAISCAEDMQRFVESSAAKWKERYGIEPQLAIGVNTGEALVGNLGSETRMEFTCVGDVVNVAARLEGLARPGQVLVTADVFAAVGDTFDFNALGDHAVRGKKQSFALYEIAR
jgi:class 3 adenylate cyclase